MCLMRCLMESASREDGRKRKKADGRKLVCSVCRTYGGTMYKHGDGYICRDCRRKEGKK
jgi:hypothetical protein